MFQQNYDPIYTQVVSNISGCNYGAYQNNILQQVYLFLKQYTNFKVSQTNMQYNNGAQATSLFLTGSVPITYKSKQYTIPLNIILPIGFPTTAPKVYLAYKLDKDSAEQNPLVKNGNEIMNNYLYKWEANNATYTLGGLCYNLAKSFEMYPPIKEAPKAKTTEVFNSIGTLANSLVNTIKTSVSHNTNGTALKEETHKVASATPPPPTVKTPEMEKREELISQVTQKLISYKELSASIPGGNNTDPISTLIANAKVELAVNSTKLQKQVLVLENEMQEMKSRNEEMKDFISKNEGKEVTKVI